jgi:hypothetical protein
MSDLDPLVFRQLAMIHRIIADETWFEGERRGCAVASDDPVVRANVCAVVLRIGADLRAVLEAAAVNAPRKLPPDHHPHAA